MDAVNSPFKGYYQPVEEEGAHRKGHNRKIITISVSLLLLLLAGILFIRNSDERPSLASSATVITSLCDVTQYRDSCIAALTSSESSNPHRIFHYSLSVAMRSLQKLTASFPAIRNGDSESQSPMVNQALAICETLLRNSIYTLNDTIKVMKQRSTIGQQEGDDMKTWLSTVITNHQTCIDTLREVNAPFVDEIELLIKKNATEFASNSLAILGVVADKEKTEFKIRLPFWIDSISEFPYWVSASDRRLLLSANPTPNVVVAKDGTGHVTTIAAAVQRIPQQSNSRFIIYVKAGVYVETVRLESNQWNVMIYGDGSSSTIISGSLNFVDGTPTFDTATVAVTGQSFMARDIGIRNSAGPAKHQAVAFRSGADLSVFYRCYFDGYQDTLYTHSNRQFYRECTITGTIDFIFGNSAVVFQNCNILPRQPMANQYNTITAQGKTDPNQNTGISIQRSTINNLDTITVPTYLGRPWMAYSTTVFMQSSLGALVNPVGWIAWTPGVVPPSTIFYGEYLNTGAGSGTGGRVTWSGVYSKMTATQATRFNVANFIQGQNWLPATGVPFDST